MSLTNALATTRFGTGRSPHLPDAGVDALLAALSGPDHMALAYPLPGFDSFSANYAASQEYRKALQAQDPNLKGQALTRAVRARFGLKDEEMAALRAHLARWIDTADGLRERMQLFWIDHFAVEGRGGGLRRAVPTFIEDAIRPHIAGRFEDMFRAAILHPMMLRYLDQDRSTAPGSRMAQRRPERGLNENLAREVLELHSFGVDGPYVQADVRALATLLAGLSMSQRDGMSFKPNMAEPRPVRVLGRDYGQGRPELGDVEAVLRDIARHPATAAHMARKLVVHFISDTPPPALVQAVEAAWRTSGGHLASVYHALLTHPQALTPTRAKIRQPFDWFATALRALGVTGAQIMALDDDETDRQIFRALNRMGAAWLRPPGPDGWPEEAGHWITPANLSARLDTAMGLARRLEALPGAAPQPLLEAGLGPLASEQLRFAVSASEVRREAAALILVSPEFQRR